MHQSQGWIKTVQRGVKELMEQEQISPYQSPNDAKKKKKNQKAQEPTIHEQGADTLGNPERRTMKEVGCETFNLIGRNQLTWEK